MNVQEIVKEWLIANGYDGLCRDGCGCKIDNLMCCDGHDISQCVPGYAGKGEYDGEVIDGIWERKGGEA